MGDVTQLIERARGGERDALDRLFELLYPELRRLARSRLARHQRSDDLGTTALVNECYLKFTRAGRLRAEDRGHFFAYCAATMRSIIVDTARAALAERRGGDLEIVPLDTGMGDGALGADETIVQVHEALDTLAAVDARLVEVVEMRWFAGMSEQEIADVLGVTERTVRRHWHKARLLLAASLRPAS
jgi:RNA polymerase sigma factor (TIGR02999 family)